MNEPKQRAFEAVMGALVGDAAALGFHWLYDQELIEQYGGKRPEFHTPNRKEYGDKGYFAHAGKRVGDYSHYGAQMLAMEEAIRVNGGYEELTYIESFQRWFDFGGLWQGYTDHPTRQTLLNLHYRKQHEEPLTSCGADDTQNPALSKLPPLVALHCEDDDFMDKVESAVRVTNNNDTAVAYAKAIALMLKSAIAGHSPQQCVEHAKHGDSKINRAIEKAELMRNQSSKSVAAEVGMHCGLDASFVVVTHLLLTTKSYQQAIRENIQCGGDSCGRAVPLGAILAACFFGSDNAIPGQWIARTVFPDAMLKS